MEERHRRHGDEDLAFARGKNRLKGQMAFALFCLSIAVGEQPAETPIGLAVCRISQGLEPVDSDEAGADEELYFSVLGFVIGAHHPGEGIAVGDADGGQAKGIGGSHHLVWMRGAAQKRKISRYSKFCVAAYLVFHVRNSSKQAVHEPAGDSRLTLVKAFAEEPEAAAVGIFDAVIITRRLGRAVTPPF